MNLNDYSLVQNLTEAYLNVYQLDEDIVRTGVSVNAAGKQIPWKHSHNTATRRSSVEDKFGERGVSIRAKERKSTNK